MSDPPWKLTEEEVRCVLGAHGIAGRAAVAKSMEILEGEIARISRAILYFTDPDMKIDGARQEMEDILKERGVVKGGKLYPPPEWPR